MLKKNGYNHLAVGWLLEKGYNPSNYQSRVLSDAATVARPETLKLLLADKRFLSLETAVESAIKYGRLDNLQLLMADQRIADRLRQDQNSLVRYILVAARSDQVDILALLVSKLDNYTVALKRRILHAASENDSLAVVQSMDAETMRDNAIDLLSTMASSDSWQVAQFLLDNFVSAEDL